MYELAVIERCHLIAEQAIGFLEFILSLVICMQRAWQVARDLELYWSRYIYSGCIVQDNGPTV